MTPDEMAPKDGVVRSPVSEKEAEEMNDEKWLEAIEIYNDRNQTACVHPTLKEWVCFGPHARPVSWRSESSSLLCPDSIDLQNC
jgi:hypothetical protein